MTQQEFFEIYKYNVRTDKKAVDTSGTIYKAFDKVFKP